MSEISLVDTANAHITDVWVVFSDIDPDYYPEPRSRLWGFLEPGFQHTECWVRITDKTWIRFDISMEIVIPKVYFDPPWEAVAHLNPTVRRVRRLVKNGNPRELFFIGPITCVESVKSFLGVSAFFVRTPFQLYNFLRKEDG